ncbi:hypothetical protein [Sporosarcina cascadiensis]|uniref:hypothetical protein n=1 Tax=Sporosarcina cascadiensis TaxID=2660747 RepID=UPI00129A8B4B|nr:hypothetical protein [Sporosarcina cascadiensis]
MDGDAPDSNKENVDFSISKAQKTEGKQEIQPTIPKRSEMDDEPKPNTENLVKGVLQEEFGRKFATNDLDESYQAIEFDVLANADNLQANFDEIAFTRKAAPIVKYLVNQVKNQFEYEEMWAWYGLENEMPSVNFNEDDLIFVGLQESASCPFEIDAVAFSAKNRMLFIFLSSPNRECTADLTPKILVIRIDKYAFKEIKSVNIVESGMETNVPWEFTKQKQ